MQRNNILIQSTNYNLETWQNSHITEWLIESVKFSMKYVASASWYNTSPKPYEYAIVGTELT